MKNTILGGLIIIFGSAVIIALCLGLCYLIVSGLWYLICLGLGIEFSWFAALAIFAICMLLRWVLSAARSKN